MKLEDLQKIPNAALPTPGQGLTLDPNGLLPVIVFAPNPANAFVLTYDSTTKQQKWAQVAVASLAGYPADSTKVLLGDGTWAQVATAQIANGTIVDADVNAAAAIAYSKLNLASSIVTGDIVNGTIVDADVSGSAALGISKLAGYPTDATKFLRGDATWAVPATAVAPVILSPVDVGGIGTGVVANQVYLTPLQGIVTPTAITKFLFGTANQSGNMDLGIYYSDDNATFTRLFSTGSFAVPAANDGAIKTFATQTITPVAGRWWYVALAADNATVTYYYNGAAGTMMGYFKTSSFPLPASVTGTTQTKVQFSIHALA